MLIGQGYTMDEATKEVKMVVEGIYSAKAALALAEKYDVRMPIIEEVNRVLFEDKPAKEAVSELMLRDRKIEHSSLEWKLLVNRIGNNWLETVIYKIISGEIIK